MKDYDVLKEEAKEGTERALSKAQQLRQQDGTVVKKLKDGDYVEINPDKPDLIGKV